jgi:hypothetical protein
MLSVSVLRSSCSTSFVGASVFLQYTGCTLRDFKAGRLAKTLSIPQGVLRRKQGKRGRGWMRLANRIGGNLERLSPLDLRRLPHCGSRLIDFLKLVLNYHLFKQRIML